MDSSENSGPRSDRRTLVKAAAIAIGGIITAIPPLAGLFVLLDPLRRKSDARGFVRVGSLGSLPESGEPRKLPVLDTQIDAWNRTPDVPVGAVYVQRTGTDAVRV